MCDSLCFLSLTFFRSLFSLLLYVNIYTDLSYVYYIRINVLSRANHKIERLITKIGTRQDSNSFRQNIKQEIDAANAQTQQIIKLMTETQEDSSQQRKALLSQFDDEFQRIQRLTQQVEVKERAAADRLSQSNRGSAQHDHGDNDSSQQSHDNYQASTQDKHQEQEEFLVFNEDELVSRYSAIRQLENDAVHVAGMYNDFRSLVMSQQESIDTLESNIANAKDYTQDAHQQLLKADDAASRARKRRCCIGGLAVFCLALLILMVYIVNM